MLSFSHYRIPRTIVRTCSIRTIVPLAQECYVFITYSFVRLAGNYLLLFNYYLLQLSFYLVAVVLTLV